MKEYTDSGCIAIVGAAFRKCLSKTKSKKEIKQRINFVDKGVMFALWCTATDQNKKRLRNFVLVRNHKFLKEL